MRSRLASGAGIGLVVGSLTGCLEPGDEEAKAAVNAVNSEFRACYEETLKVDGARHYEVAQTQAFETMRATLTELGFRVDGQDVDLGHLVAIGPAPRPLNASEWRRAAEVDLPHLRKIVVPHVGFKGNWVKFEPDGLNVILNVSVLELSDATEISLTMRFDEVEPPKQGYPRRTYPPCEATRMGLGKIWTHFEAGLGV